MMGDVTRSKDQRVGAPCSIKDVLAPTVEHLCSGVQAKAFGAWRRACPPNISRFARPSRFHNGTLTIECDSSIWVSELKFQSSELLERIARTTPNNPIERLRLVVDPMPDRRVGCETASDRRQRSVEPPRLEARSLATAVAAACEVRDERLRRAIEKALDSSMGRK